MTGSGEKARPLGPEVKKRDVGAARDDWSSYLLSNQQANQQMDDEDAPPPIPDPAEPELPQLPESYRRTIDAFKPRLQHRETAWMCLD